ncbi:sigma-70 family RNA polymerase sigma factor [Jiangella mangrovi]|uniref:RNA polymerase sigma-70 factor (ECF subfamily) n=1 Tax=Jiangella mangrovi TaxID=1524084 RepID=A0A7W9LK61_9ACTN|nr:sigma-70 family RNA polymerase sigma factor [Jiangella mangrovi]MBB5786850.1 RNA polymerase sigma-70 factor (ECF subfamily) [Jiangella mangrovi]
MTVTMSPSEARADEFARQADPYRRELLAHCYRMLGSLHDAEDTVQETYLRAWRGYAGFEGRASLRTWLYTIATRACLRAIESRGRRALPSGLAGPAADPEAALDPPLTDVAWLEPFPDDGSSGGDPAAVAVGRESTRLALVAALQYLPARQRAVLILRDVLRWRAAEVASLLDTTTTAVNSALRRARTQLDGLGVDAVTPAPLDGRQRDLLDRYATAFERADVDGLVRLLAHDAVLEMPPHATWFRGAEAVGRFLAPRLGSPGSMRTVRVRANGQPAHAMYKCDADGVHRAHGVVVLTTAGERIERLTVFLGAEWVSAFGLPAVHRAGATT